MARKNWIRLAVIFLLTAVFLFFFFRKTDWNEVFFYLGKVNLVFFIITIILVPLHFFTRAFRWKYLLIHEKKELRFYNLVAGNAVGFTVTFIFPGRLGEVVKPLYLARKENIRTGFALGTVVVERIFDMFTMCFLLGVFLLARPLYESSFKFGTESFKHLYLWGIVGLGFATALLAFSLFFYFFREKALRVAGFFLKPLPLRWREKIIKLLHEFIDGLKFFHSLGNLLIYVVLSIVVWLGIIFLYWVSFFAFNIRIPFYAMLPYVFLTGVGASFPTPGMAGGYHYFSKLGLTSLYGIDPNLAVGMTTVVHAVQLVTTCLIGYTILWKEGLTVFQLKKLGEKVES
jgi:uncharacterized protein (TIRG00374 family)